jgi:hypothetical protein
MTKQIDPIFVLRLACKNAGGQATWAIAHNISKSYVCDVLKGRREIGEKILKELDLVRIVSYIRRS